MDKQCIFSSNGPPAAGPYSHAVVAGPYVFVSGQGPFAPDGSGVQRGTMEQEARLALSNLKTVLEDAGSSLEKTVKVTAYLANMDDFQAFNEVYKEFFATDCPARTCFQAGRLPFDIQVEVEAIALSPS